MIPNILSIAGSDSSGGAGLQADIKTISALGGYAMTVVTAVTAQNTQGVSAVMPIPPETIRAQIQAVRDDIATHAVKIGMLGTAPAIAAVAEGLAAFSCPVVLDPVMIAKGGARLLGQDAVAALGLLLGRATLITPNLPEAAALLDLPEAATRTEMERQAHALLRRGAGAVLLKGGHLAAEDSPDLLWTRDAGALWFEGRRIATANSHGTGCTLSSAIATALGKGLPLPEAVAQAKAYLTGALAAAGELAVGHGHGPVHHFAGLR